MGNFPLFLHIGYDVAQCLILNCLSFMWNLLEFGISQCMEYYHMMKLSNLIMQLRFVQGQILYFLSHLQCFQLKELKAQLS